MVINIRARLHKEARRNRRASFRIHPCSDGIWSRKACSRAQGFEWFEGSIADSPVEEFIRCSQPPQTFKLLKPLEPSTDPCSNGIDLDLFNMANVLKSVMS